MATYRIAIVNSSSFGKLFPEHIETLKTIGPVERFDFAATADESQLARDLAGFNIIVAGVTPFYQQKFFAEKDELLLITRHGIGYDNIDIQEARRHGTTVSIVSAKVERDAVAENAIANLMAVMRQIVPAQQAAKENRWADRAKFIGHNITGKTVGIIGCGNIGSRVAEIFRHGFLARVLVYDPNLDMAWAGHNGIESVDLDTLLANADILSLHASLNRDSFHILNDAAFKKMKRGVYITNTARGDLIDENAILRALDAGIVCAFATDVMHEEPSPNTHAYFAHKRILITPHTSAYTIECLRGMGEKCVDDVLRIVSNRVPLRTLT